MIPLDWDRATPRDFKFSLTAVPLFGLKRPLF
jgi:hypothetical protein